MDSHTSNLRLVTRVETQDILNEYYANTYRMMRREQFYKGHYDNLVIDLVIPKTKKKYHTTISYHKEVVPNELRTEETEFSWYYPKLMETLHDFARVYGRGFLSRALLTEISNEEPHKDYTHIDIGCFYIFHDRYHFVVHSKGSEMTVEGVTKIFTTGDIFFINNKLPHNGGHSFSNEKRIHVFLDVLPRNPFKIVFMYGKWLFYYGSIHRKNYSLTRRLSGVEDLFVALYLSLFAYRKNRK